MDKNRDKLMDWPLQLMVYGVESVSNQRIPGSSGMIEQLEHLQTIVTNSVVNAIAQIHLSYGPTLRWVLDPGKRLSPLLVHTPGVAHPNDIEGFVYWASQICPSERHVLVFTSSTKAENSFFNYEEFLQNQQLSEETRFQPLCRIPISDIAIGIERAVQRISKKLSTVVFDRCLISSFEMLASLQDAVSTVVYSSHPNFHFGFNLERAVSNFTSEMGVMSNQFIAKTLVNSSHNSSKHGYAISIDLENGFFQKAIENFEAFSAGFFKWLRSDPQLKQSVKNHISFALEKVVEGLPSLDFEHFENIIKEIPNIPSSLLSSLKTCKSQLNKATLNRHGAEKLVGVSMYLPTSSYEYLELRPYYIRSRFSSLTRWDRVMDLLYDFQGEHAQSKAKVKGEKVS